MKRLLLIPSVLEAARLLPDPRGLPSDAELLLCGVGLLRAGLLTAERLARGDVRDVLLVGLAGTRDEVAAPVGALVVGSAVRNEAFGAGHGTNFLGLDEMGLRGELLDPELLSLAAPTVQGGALTPAPSAAVAANLLCIRSGLRVITHGVFGSVAAASGSPTEAAAWRFRHPDVIAEDMETWAVAVACARADVPLACVRAISNAAGERSKAEWDLDGACAALRAVLPALLAAASFVPVPYLPPCRP